MRSLSMVMAGAILLGGCAATPPLHWTKPGASEEAVHTGSFGLRSTNTGRPVVFL